MLYYWFCDLSICLTFLRIFQIYSFHITMVLRHIRAILEEGPSVPVITGELEK